MVLRKKVLQHDWCCRNISCNRLDVAKQNTVVVHREPVGRWLQRSSAAHPRHGTAAGEHRTSDQVASWGRATQRELGAVRVAWGGDDSTGTREEESGDFSQDLDPATEPLLRWERLLQRANCKNLSWWPWGTWRADKVTDAGLWSAGWSIEFGLKKMFVQLFKSVDDYKKMYINIYKKSHV